MTTITVIKKNRVGTQREYIVDFAFDNSYPTGGESFKPSDLDSTMGTAALFHFVQPVQKTLGNRVCIYDYSASKLMLFTALGTEATGASDQSTITVRVNCRFGGSVG